MGFKRNLPQREKAPQPGENHAFDDFMEQWCEWEPEDREGWWYEWKDYEFSFFEEQQDQHKQAYIMAFLHKRYAMQEEEAERSDTDVKSLKEAAADLRRKWQEK